MGWTDERVADLKKLWLDGLSASQIAKQLGGVTRNAVIGKVHRLGLSGRAAPSQPSRPAFRAARPRPTQAPSAPRRIDPAPRPVVAAQPTPPAPRPAVLDLPGTATVLTLGAHMCNGRSVIRRQTSSASAGAAPTKAIPTVWNIRAWPISRPRRRTAARNWPARCAATSDLRDGRGRQASTVIALRSAGSGRASGAVVAVRVDAAPSSYSARA